MPLPGQYARYESIVKEDAIDPEEIGLRISAYRTAIECLCMPDLFAIDPSLPFTTWRFFALMHPWPVLKEPKIWPKWLLTFVKFAYICCKESAIPTHSEAGQHREARRFFLVQVRERCWEQQAQPMLLYALRALFQRFETLFLKGLGQAHYNILKHRLYEEIEFPKCQPMFVCPAPK